MYVCMYVLPVVTLNFELGLYCNWANSILTYNSDPLEKTLQKI